MRKIKKTLQLAKPYYVNILSKSGSFNALKFMPRLFTLSTNNNSYLFNTDLLAWSSKTISKYIDDNPTNLKYHLNIIDDKNIIEKIGKIYQGELVEFKQNEYKLLQTFVEELKLLNMPEITFGWSKSRETIELDFNKKHYIEFNLIESSIKIDQSSLINFLCSKKLFQFTQKRINMFVILEFLVHQLFVNFLRKIQMPINICMNLTMKKVNLDIYVIFSIFKMFNFQA